MRFGVCFAAEVLFGDQAVITVLDFSLLILDYISFPVADLPLNIFT